ncbi:MAG: hypothetical protein DSZ06_03560 [Sulfurospirillum sp.]|nr:MAG: hypothetical protein DSZ06_03560 [Sulfurospirillum sp.]
MKKFIIAMAIGGVFLSSAYAEGMLGKIEKESDKEVYNRVFTLAKSGDINSQTLLGEMLLDGIGVKADLDKAFYWISKASNSGDADASYLLGFMYENGIKVHVNLQRAATLYEKGAREGSLMAKFHLAFMYHKGIGVQKDNKKAISLLEEIKKEKSKIRLSRS